MKHPNTIASRNYQYKIEALLRAALEDANMNPYERSNPALQRQIAAALSTVRARITELEGV